MKKSLLLLLLASLSQPAQAQNCANAYGLLQEGLHLEYTTYNKKGEADLTIKQVCSKLETRNDTLIATMEAQASNSEGEQQPGVRNFQLKCFAGIIYMNMQSVMPAQQSSPGQGGLEMQIDGGDMVYPADMQPGQTLPDAEMVARASTGGVQLMKMRYKITNRKVESAEKVTTKAGTFDCLKITYDLEMNLLGKKTYHSAQWFAKNVGMVKTETYDKKGGLESSMQLTLFQK